MAITTIQGLADGRVPPCHYYKTNSSHEQAGIWVSSWMLGSLPAAAATPASGINGEALSSTSAQVQGQLPFTDPASGNTYLSGARVLASINGTLMLADRLWQNSGIVVTTTTEQAITPAALPARDRDGSTNGVGVMAAIECITANGSGAVTNTTLNYTNSSGTAGRTGTLSSWPGSAQASTFVMFNLQTGDVGVRSVEGITLGTSYASGTISLVLFRPIAILPHTRALDPGTLSFGLKHGAPRMYNGSVPFVLVMPSTTAAANYGPCTFQWSQG